MATKEPTSDADLEALKQQVKALQFQLDISEGRREEAEALSKANAHSGLQVALSEEQPTGRTVSTEICLNPWEKDIKKQKFETVELPTFMFTINLPEAGGTHLGTNGFPHYHGETYEVDAHTLADLKSRVANCWAHERAIHTPTEKALNQYIDTRLRSAAAASRSLPPPA